MKNQPDAVPDGNIPPEIFEKRSAEIARRNGRSPQEVTPEDQRRALRELRAEAKDAPRKADP